MFSSGFCERGDDKASFRYAVGVCWCWESGGYVMFHVNVCDNTICCHCRQLLSDSASSSPMLLNARQTSYSL